MSFGNYKELKAAIASRMNRTDLTAKIPDYIRLAEARISRALDGRTGVSTITFSTLSPPSIPHGFRKALSLMLPDERVQVEYLEPANFGSTIISTPGRPCFFTIEGNQIRFLPDSDTGYTAILTYEGRMCNLERDSDSNFVLKHYPDAYLYGSLIEGGDDLRDDERIPRWEGRFAQALEYLQLEVNNAGDEYLRADEFTQPAYRQRYGYHNGYTDF